MLRIRDLRVHEPADDVGQSLPQKRLATEGQAMADVDAVGLAIVGVGRILRGCVEDDVGNLAGDVPHVVSPEKIGVVADPMGHH